MIGGVKSKTPSEAGRQEIEQFRLLAVGKNSIILLSARFKKKIQKKTRAQKGFCRAVSESPGHPLLWTLVLGDNIAQQVFYDVTKVFSGKGSVTVGSMLRTKRTGSLR